MNISHFLFGKAEFKISDGDAAKLSNILMSSSLAISDTEFKDGFFYFSSHGFSAKKLLSLCKLYGIECNAVKKSGLPYFLLRYKKRFGIFIGIPLYLFIVFAATAFIWSFEFEGNLSMSDDDLKAILSEHGVHVGSSKKSIDVHSVENNVMISSDEIAWISLNISGSVCRVEIRELVAPKNEDPMGAANVVAAKDGRIVLFENTRGNIVLNIGDYVREGELIISGLYDSKQAGVRYTEAKGRVFAETEYEISADVPLEYDKKSYTGRSFTEKYLIFFEKEIKIFGNCGNLYGSCDTIEKVEYFDPLSMGELPVGIRTVTHLEYSYEHIRRTEEEAERLASYKLERLLSQYSKDKELLKKELSSALTDSEYRITARLTVIEDIAKQKKIEIADLP